MNENPEGTPNPLNPGFGTFSNAPKPQEVSETEAAGTGMLDYTEAPAPEAPAPETPAPVVETPEAPAPKPFPRRSQKIVDPMMRPVSHQTVDGPDNNQNFDTLEMEDLSIEELTTDTPVEPIGTPINTPVNPSMPVSRPEMRSNFEPKGSVVEPAGKKSGKKKALIIGAIILVMSAIICGAAAIAIAVMNNSGDKVTKAINKLLDGGMPSIVSARGSVTYATPDIFDANIDFNGAFDFATTASKVTANATMNYPGDITATINIDELTTRDGDTYFKVNGLNSILAIFMPATEDGTLSIYDNLISGVEDQWILSSDDFGESMEGLNIFDNSSTCLISAFNNLPTYGKDLANKYKANSFITSTTNDARIVKVKNDLYKIGFDSDKMAAFINSLSGSGFMNELTACVSDTTTNVNVSADTLKQVFNGFPTVYVEIDDNYNITRVYLDASIETGDDTYTTVTADISLSYPSKIEINEPAEYINMSTLLNNLMTGVLMSGETNTAESNNTNQ